MIVVDQMRGDCLSRRGHPIVETPWLGHPARDGVSFTHAYSAVPICIAARAALFTGLSQDHHGRLGYQDRVPWDYRRTLAECFRAQGYQTHCVGKMHVWPARDRLGFDEVELHDGYLRTNRDLHIPTAKHGTLGRGVTNNRPQLAQPPNFKIRPNGTSVGHFIRVIPAGVNAEIPAATDIRTRRIPDHQYQTFIRNAAHPQRVCKKRMGGLRAAGVFAKFKSGKKTSQPIRIRIDQEVFLL